MVFLLAGTPSLLAQGPRLRATLEPASGIWVGQPATLEILVQVPTWFTGGVDIPDLEVEGLILRRAPGRAVSSTDREGDVTWAGLRHDFLVYALRAGDLEIPSISVGVRYSKDSKSHGPVELRTEPLYFSATVPETARGLGYFVASSSFEFVETLDPAEGELRQGDVLRRQITQEAPESIAMLLPPVAFESMPGLSVYPEPPIIQDKGGERGSGRTAIRQDAATYVFEKPGNYILPAVQRSWWDLGAGELRTVKIDSVALEVGLNPDLAEEHLGGLNDAEAEGASVEKRGRSILDWTRLVLPGFAILFALAWIFRRLSKVLGERDSRPPDFGAEALEKFRRAARENRAAEAYASLTDWALKARSHTSLKALLSSADEGALAREVDSLAHQLYGSADAKSAWRGEALLAAFEDHLRKEPSSQRRGEGEAELPALNPSGTQAA